MPNPLRLPIVLIAIFSLMLFYVHSYHRRHSRGGDLPLSEQEDLQLRQPRGREDHATFASPSRIDLRTPPRPMDHAGAPEPGGSHLAGSLPKVNDTPPPVAQGSMTATLWPPSSLDSTRVAPQASEPTQSTMQTLKTDRSQIAHSASSVTEPSAAEVMHRIVDGDTLAGLAESYLGDASRYPELLEANREVLIHPDLLPLGTRIRIPRSPARRAQ
jgi:hypothetical protein